MIGEQQHQTYKQSQNSYPLHTSSGISKYGVQSSVAAPNSTASLIGTKSTVSSSPTTKSASVFNTVGVTKTNGYVDSTTTSVMPQSLSEIGAATSSYASKYTTASQPVPAPRRSNSTLDEDVALPTSSQHSGIINTDQSSGHLITNGRPTAAPGITSVPLTATTATPTATFSTNTNETTEPQVSLSVFGQTLQEDSTF